MTISKFKKSNPYYLQVILRCVFLLSLALTACTPLPVPNSIEDTNNHTVLPTTITFATYSTYTAEFKPLIATFNAQNQDIQVRLVELTTYTPPEEIVKQADTALVDGLSITKNIYAQDIRPLLDADATIGMDDFIVTSQVESGSSFILPRTIRVPLLVYNQDLFEKAHIQLPKPDSSWHDLVTVLQQVVSSTNNIRIYGLLDFTTGRESLVRVLQDNGVSLQGTTIPFNEPQLRVGLQQFIDLVNSRVLYNPSLADKTIHSTEQLAIPIQNGTITMWPYNNAFPPQSNGSPLPFEVGIVQDPRKQLSINDGFIISRGTTHRDAAWRWLRFVSQQVPATQDITIIPAQKLQAQRTIEQLPQAQQTMLSNALPQSTPPPMSFATEAALDSIIRSLIRDHKPIDEAIRKAEQIQSDAVVYSERTPEPIIVATPPPEISPNTKVITFSADGLDSTALREIVRQFEQVYPDIHIDIHTAFDSENTSVNQQINSPQTDCYVSRDIKHNTSFDIQPLIDADARFPRDDYPSALMQTAEDGKFYSLPYAMEAPVLVANKVLLDQAGIPIPTQPLNIRDVINIAQKLTNKVVV